MRFYFKLCTMLLLLCAPALTQQTHTPHPSFEYLWYEAENMRGFSTDAMHEPILNPSFLTLTRAQAPGWGMNGPGVSAEWSQGGESEWNSAAASADETSAKLNQEIEIPRDGQYKVWVRYADWIGKTENFNLRIERQGQTLFREEFGARDILSAHDEVGAYWGWAFVWDGSQSVALLKGAARLSIEITQAAEARRHVDCVLITNDLSFVPDGRRKPEFSAQRVLRAQSAQTKPLMPLLEVDTRGAAPQVWRRPQIAGRDFLMPWNIAPAFWSLYDKPATERPLYPFNAEPIEEFIAKYKGMRDVPLFSSQLIVPVIYINDLPQYLKEGSPFLRFLRETHAPFAVLINYGTAQMSETDGQAAWKLLTGELRDQFIGWISGESIGHVWGDAAANLKLSPAMSRRELLDAYHNFYTHALERKWATLFHAETGAMWDKLIAAQSTSSTADAHALNRWGARLTGLEIAAVMPNVAMRIAFTRGAARQYGGGFLYYHAPNFGDAATAFTKQQDFAGPDHFYHTRYGATMGPSLAWYRKSYYLFYMAGASAIYLEQGGDQFFKPGPGEHPFQLNPLGRITQEFMNFAARHVARGTPETPVAFLLDPAHGWDMNDYPQWSFGIKPQERSDRALRELFGAAYYPALVTEGEPATADRQAYVNGIFGDIFDVLVASDEHRVAANAYRALVVGGRIEWSRAWVDQLKSYVERGGTIVLNAAQLKGLPEELTGVHLVGASIEADDAKCLAPNETAIDLRGGVFRYERIERRGAEVLMQTLTGDPLVTINKIGRGQVVFCAVPDLLGLDERLTPVAAHLFAHLFAAVSPVRVAGDVQHLINRTERGWVVTLINNNGVFKPQQGMAQVDRSATIEATLDLRGKQIVSAREWTDDVPLDIRRDNNSELVKIRVPPGEVKIVELVIGTH